MQTRVARDVADSAAAVQDSLYSWGRLLVCLLIGAVGNVGMWSVVVVLPTVQQDFGIPRNGASFPYAMSMIGYAVGGYVMGRIADRFGIMIPILIGSFSLFTGFLLTSQVTSILQFAIVQGVLIGFLGSAAVFGPLMADISMWFERRRGLAVAMVASGNYISGTIWPPLVQRMVDTIGWRETHVVIGVVVLLIMLPLAFLLNRRSPRHHQAGGANGNGLKPLPAPPGVMIGLLMLAGVSCCVAMSMPQAHIVAYCGDLGYGNQHGADMLAVLLGLGVVSRLVSGWVLDKVGGFPTLIVGSVLQAVALALYIPFDSLPALYLISAFFGIVQGGIVPSYAIVIREHFPPAEAGAKFGLVLGSTIAGMALGGWVSGAIFDMTGSYRAAFINGVAWNILNIVIVLWLMMRARARRTEPALAPA